jgi:hypothetical protein
MRTYVGADPLILILPVDEGKFPASHHGLFISHCIHNSAEDKNLSPLPRIKPRLLGHPVPNLFAIPAELFRLPTLSEWINKEVAVGRCLPPTQASIHM